MSSPKRPAPEPLEFHELERIYFWLNRQRLMEQRHLSEPSLRDLEECEARVQAHMLAARPGEATAIAWCMCGDSMRAGRSMCINCEVVRG